MNSRCQGLGLNRWIILGLIDLDLSMYLKLSSLHGPSKYGNNEIALGIFWTDLQVRK